MHAKYDPARCNIANCNLPQQSLFLCDKHQQEYLTTELARRLQEEVVALYNNTAALSLRIRAFLWTILHYTTNAKVPFVEHFPLESLYLLHRRDLLIRVAKSTGNREENCKGLKMLINDYNHAANETLEELKLLCARYCSDPRYVYNRTLEVTDQLQEFAVFKPRTYAFFASIVLVFFIGIALAEKQSGFHVQFPISLTIPHLIVPYYICLGLVIGGLYF